VESHHDLFLLFEHDLFGKPVSTFPDHALEGLRECNAMGRRTAAKLPSFNATAML
jgi:hypothetical protein